jgi:hypothetical protein
MKNILLLLTLVVFAPCGESSYKLNISCINQANISNDYIFVDIKYNNGKYDGPANHRPPEGKYEEYLSDFKSLLQLSSTKMKSAAVVDPKKFVKYYSVTIKTDGNVQTWYVKSIQGLLPEVEKKYGPFGIIVGTGDKGNFSITDAKSLEDSVKAVKKIIEDNPDKKSDVSKQWLHAVCWYENTAKFNGTNPKSISEAMISSGASSLLTTLSEKYQKHLFIVDER